MDYTKRLQGRIAIITGASRKKGLGTAICRSLAEAGADVFFTYWRSYDETMDWGAEPEWPDKLADELRSFGVRVSHLEIDLMSVDAPTQILDKVAAELGQPSILVNNATHSTDDGYENLNADILDAHYRVNVRGTCLLSTEFARRHTSSQEGRIINLVSGQDKGPQPGELAYVATKGAVSAFTVSLAAEVAALGITVNAIDPGPTDTGWMSDELKDNLLPKFPMNRMGQPKDAANLVTFLASHEAQWITGQIIHSDGGFFN